MSEPMFGIDGARTREEVARWAAGFEEKAARYQQMQQQVSAVTAQASSPEGVVQVTVDSGGALADLHITDGVRRMSGEQVSRAVLDTIRRAQAGISERVAEITTATVGDEPETANAIVSAYRDRFPDPDAAPERRDEPPEDDGDFSDETYLR